MDNLIILGHTGYLGKALMGGLKKIEGYNSILGFSSNDIDLTDSSQLFQIKEVSDERTVIIMCAAIKSDEGNSLNTFKLNLRMAENIAKLSSECKYKKIILISSNAVYGVHKKHKVISEKSNLYPDTFYSLSKYTTEKLLLINMEERMHKLVILRPSTIYGPGESITPHTPSGFLNKYLNGDKITLWGDGTELREFVFINDIVRLINRIIKSSFSGVLNIGGGKPRSYKDALDIISKILNKKIKIYSKPRTVSPVDKIYDLKLINELFPDFKFTSLEEGLEFTYKNSI